MSIKLLPEEISNQIAAGEVVERPASVVKECVENALDAGAQNIEVRLENGGKSLIQVIDDGAGIFEEDLPKAVLRHATSKISTTDDLFHLSQYGFRGEALAAVSSVSNFTLTSRTEDQTYQWHNNQVTEVSGNQGTTVTIKKLFGPTPARLEYLKSDEAEYRACVKELYGFALARPDVSFKVWKNEKLSIDYPATSGNERVAQVLKKLSADLCPVEFQSRNVQITGFVSSPGQGLSHRNQQYLLVNGRRVEDHRLAYAVREAYVQTCGIEKHLHPAFVLHVDLDPILVDVNVHPRKLEVKFAEPGEVFSAVKQAVMLGLEKVSYQPNNHSESLSRHWGALEGGLKAPAKQVSAGNYFNTQLAEKSKIQNSKFNIPTHSFTQRNQQISFSPAQSEDVHSPSTINHSPLTLIGQADNKYIVAQSTEGLYFFDQHALHERQRFEDFWQAYKNSAITSQPLLVPETITLTETEASLLHEQQKTLQALGFVLLFPQDDQVVINEVPELLVGQDLTRVLQLCVEFLQSEKLGENVLDQMMRKLLEYKACRGAVMFGDKLEREEMEKLIADFDSTDWKLLCPHGRPNHHFVPFEDLDKQFHR